MLLTYQLLALFISFVYSVCHMQVCHRYHMSTVCFDKFQSTVMYLLLYYPAIIDATADNINMQPTAYRVRYL